MAGRVGGGVRGLEIINREPQLTERGIGSLKPVQRLMGR